MLKERKFGATVTPNDVEMVSVSSLLDPGYLVSLETAWGDWKAAGQSGEIIAAGTPTRRQRHDRILAA